jgi:hypothetical protein
MIDQKQLENLKCFKYLGVNVTCYFWAIFCPVNQLNKLMFFVLFVFAYL